MAIIGDARGHGLHGGVHGRVIHLRNRNRPVFGTMKPRNGQSRHEGKQGGHERQGDCKDAHMFKLGWLDRPDKMQHAVDGQNRRQ